MHHITAYNQRTLANYQQDIVTMVRLHYGVQRSHFDVYAHICVIIKSRDTNHWCLHIFFILSMQHIKIIKLNDIFFVYEVKLPTGHVIQNNLVL